MSDLVSKSVQDEASLGVQRRSSFAMSGSIPKAIGLWLVRSRELIGVCRRPCTNLDLQNTVFCRVSISSWKFGLASPPDRIEILVGALSSSTLPEKTYKRPLKPNIKCGGDLWTAGGRAPPSGFFSLRKKNTFQCCPPAFLSLFSGSSSYVFLRNCQILLPCSVLSMKPHGRSGWKTHL